MKINHFHSLLRKSILQTSRNKKRSQPSNSRGRTGHLPEDIRHARITRYGKTQMAQVGFWPNTKKLPVFIGKLSQGTDNVFGEIAHSPIDSSLHGKLPSKLKWSVNMARWEKCAYDEIVEHLERELEQNAQEESDNLPKTTTSTTSSNYKKLLSNGIAQTQTVNALIATPMTLLG